MDSLITLINTGNDNCRYILTVAGPDNGLNEIPILGHLCSDIKSRRQLPPCVGTSRCDMEAAVFKVTITHFIHNGVTELVLYDR